MALAQRMLFAPNGFRYLNGEYLFEDVRHIDWTREQITQVDRQHRKTVKYSAQLVVTMANGKAVTITDKSQLSSVNLTTREDTHNVIVNAALRLLEQTFDARMDGYERDMQARGYVNWGPYQLTAKGELYRRNAFCFVLNNPKIECILYPFKLACIRRNRRWWSRVLQRLVFNTEVVSLERDRDCFLFLIRKYAGIFWATETLRLHRGMGADGTTAHPKEEARAEVPPRTADAESARASPPPPQPAPRLGVEHYLGVLALPPESEWAVVKAEYRRLVKVYHPDLMRGRGAAEAELHTAENTLKTINEAFGWLEDYYRIKPKG